MLENLRNLLRNVNFQSFFNLIKIKEVLWLGCLTLCREKLLELTQVGKDIVKLCSIFSLESFLGLFEEEVSALLSHHGVISLKGYLW